MTFRAGALAVMLLALFAIAATGSASATELCTDSECTTVYPTGTKLSFSLKPGTTSVLKSGGGTTIATCTESTVSGKTSNESGATISVGIESMAWGGCSQTTDTVATGSLSIEGFSGTTNGTISGSGSEVTFGVFGVSCTYGTGTGTKLGTLTRGEEPILPISTTLPKRAGGFLCPSTAGWEAEYVLTEPHALFLEVPDPQFMSEASPITVKGGPATLGQHKFFTGQRTITCNKATLTSPASGTPTSGLTLTPQYEECTSGLGLPATVKPNQCAYGVGVSGTFIIKDCIAKMELIVYSSAANHAAEAALCRYKIGNQTPMGRSVTFVNGGVLAGRDITFRFEVKGWRSKRSKARIWNAA